LEVITLKMKRLVRVSAGPDGEVKLAVRPIKYALRKESLDEAIDVIETWQRISDPSWFLIMRLNNNQLDAEILSGTSALASIIPSTTAIRAGSVDERSSLHLGPTGLSLPAAALDEMTVSNICLSDIKLAHNPRTRVTYILNTVIVTDPSYQRIMKGTVRQLTRRLQHDEPRNFGLLSCKGFVTNAPQTNAAMYGSFTMVFRIPLGLSNPRSLRDYLIHTQNLDSLSYRFDIARELAKAVSYVHTFGFIHKNIRPETTLIFSSFDSPNLFTSLIGFDNFRKEEGHTLRRGDNTLEQNLYRHPSRQGVSPKADYAMQHDIYSLGVCLLEIGLWESFVIYNELDENPSVSGGLLAMSPLSSEETTPQSFVTTLAKEVFLSLARIRLPRCMGTKYAKVVEICLTCLDADNDFGSLENFDENDDIAVAVSYIDKVLLSLNSLDI
jgi:hypothetical protein